jgi:hypothetical protein
LSTGLTELAKLRELRRLIRALLTGLARALRL